MTKIFTLMTKKLTLITKNLTNFDENDPFLSVKKQKN